jgi:hypothetical protein
MPKSRSWIYGVEWNFQRMRFFWKNVYLLVKFRSLFQRCSYFLGEISGILVEVSTSMFTLRVVDISEIIESSCLENLFKGNFIMLYAEISWSVVLSAISQIAGISQSSKGLGRVDVLRGKKLWWASWIHQTCRLRKRQQQNQEFTRNFR